MLEHTRLPAVAAALLAAPAIAQEAMYTEAATTASPHTLIIREQFHYMRYGHNPVTHHSDSEKYEAKTSLQYGIARGVSFTLDIPVQVMSEKHMGQRRWDRGVDDLTATVKWRFYQDDSGGINTLRAALLLSADVASGDDHDFSSQTVNPIIGAVVTKVWGRHGFNQDIKYKFNTGGHRSKNDGGEGPDNALFFNTAYVYRIIPSRYTAETTGAWYVTAEINGLYETNGDVEFRFSPGLMYEGREFGVEFMMQLPLHHDLDNRAEQDLAVGAGIRLLF